MIYNIFVVKHFSFFLSPVFGLVLRLKITFRSNILKRPVLAPGIAPYGGIALPQAG